MPRIWAEAPGAIGAPAPSNSAFCPHAIICPGADHSVIRDKCIPTRTPQQHPSSPASLRQWPAPSTSAFCPHAMMCPEADHSVIRDKFMPIRDKCIPTRTPQQHPSSPASLRQWPAPSTSAFCPHAMMCPEADHSVIRDKFMPIRDKCIPTQTPQQHPSSPASLRQWPASFWGCSPEGRRYLQGRRESLTL